MKLTALADACTDFDTVDMQRQCSLRVQNESFRIPVRPLVASSDYFRSMLSGWWSEHGLNEIELKGPIPSANAMKILLEFVCSGELRLKETEIEETVAAADFLQMNTAFEALGNYLRLNNWTVFSQIAYKYNCDPLREIVLKFVSDNYRRLKRTSEFQIYLTGEEKRQAAELPFTMRKSVVAVCIDEPTQNRQKCLRRPRIQYFHRSQKKWKELTRLPEIFCQPSSKVQLASMGHRIYGIGWSLYNDALTSTKRAICDKSFKYDVKVDEWSTFQSVGIDVREKDLPFVRFAAAADYLFVFGRGIHRRYCPLAQRWMEIKPFPDFPLDQLSLQYAEYTVATHQGSLLVLFESPFDDVSVARYDPYLDKWSSPFRLPAVRNPPWCGILSDDRTINILVPEYKRLTSIENLTGEGLSLNVLSYDDKIKKIAWLDVIRDDRFDRMTNMGTRYISLDGALYRVSADYTVIHDVAGKNTQFISSGFECKSFSSEEHHIHAFVVHLPESIFA